MPLKFWQVSEASQGKTARWLMLESGAKSPRVAVVSGISRATIDKLPADHEFDDVLQTYGGTGVDPEKIATYLDLLRIGIIPPGKHHHPPRTAALRAKKPAPARKGTRSRK